MSSTSELSSIFQTIAKILQNFDKTITVIAVIMLMLLACNVIRLLIDDIINKEEKRKLKRQDLIAHENIAKSLQILIDLQSKAQSLQNTNDATCSTCALIKPPEYSTSMTDAQVAIYKLFGLKYTEYSLPCISGNLIPVHIRSDVSLDKVREIVALTVHNS